AQVALEVLADLRVLVRLCERLHPQTREQDSLLLRLLHRALDRPDPVAGLGPLQRRAVPDRADLPPGLVDAGEEEVSLRREVAVEDGLGHPRLARDLGRRDAAVAAAREDVAGDVEEVRAALLGGETGARDRHAAAAAPASASACRYFRTVSTATTAPASAIPAAT